MVWAIEDCRHPSAWLERDLLSFGQKVVRVPPKLMAQTRKSARTRGKSDPNDALAVARAFLRESDLPRCRSMSLAARGDVDAAEQMARQALVEHDRIPMRFERARTQLLLGQLQRRQRQKDTATETLKHALAAFEDIGTPLWADRARAELARTNVAPSRDVLTPSERRVAELAASGKTNRDVASALFISPKTVEANLARIYRKLGIKSRAELGRLIGDSEPIV